MLRIIPLLALLALASCSSPLDVGTERIETRLTNGLKLRTVSASVRIIRDTDSILVEEWEYGVGSSRFSADTTAQPPSITLQRTMTGAPIPGKTSWLKELSIRLDDVATEGTIPMGGTAGQGNGAAATVVIEGAEHHSTRSDNANASIHHFSSNGRRTVQGTIVLGMNRSPLFTVVVAVNFTASQD